MVYKLFFILFGANVVKLSNLLVLFDVTTYAAMPAETGKSRILSTRQPNSQSLLRRTVHMRLEPVTSMLLIRTNYRLYHWIALRH